jgi:outer membrane protein OmpA-like peptidoglycan-associated protein
VKRPYSTGRLDVWPAFTDFVTSLSLLLVLLLASAPWFLASEILAPPPSSEAAGGESGQDGSSPVEVFNPARELKRRQDELRRVLPPGVEQYTDGQHQRIIFADQAGRGILFETESSDLKPEFRARIRPLRRILVGFLEQGYLKNIEVEGHSDLVPFRGGTEDNWSLSARRAVSVARFLMVDPENRRGGTIPPWFVTAKGHGEYRPAGFSGIPSAQDQQRIPDGYGGSQYHYVVERSRSESARARNRRIEVLLVYRWPGEDEAR